MGQWEEGLYGVSFDRAKLAGKRGETAHLRFHQVSFAEMILIIALSPCEIAEVPRGLLGALLPRRHDAIKTIMYI